MIVRPITIINPMGVESANSASIRVGADYLVLEMYITPEQRFVRLLSDQGGAPGLWPLEMFEVVSPTISSNWGASITRNDGNTYLDLAPTAWLRPGFWMDYLDRAWEGAGAVFDEALAEMAAEAGLPPDGRVPEGAPPAG